MAKAKDVTLEKVEEKEVKKIVKKTAKAKIATKAKTSVKIAEKKTPVKEVSEAKVPKAKSVKKEVKATTKSTVDKKAKNVPVEKTDGKKTTTKQKNQKTVNQDNKKVFVRSDKKKVKGSVIFVRPQAIKMERNEDGKAIGLSMSGFQSPDGQYYKINIPFISEDGKITGKILTSEETARFPGWGVITMEENAILTMTNVVNGEEATLDRQAFKNFVVNKNRKIESELALKQNKAKINEKKIKDMKVKSNNGVADGR